ncbi:hypothetical protein DFH07DRAFT_936873 [Mycena maculata]|uniref:Cysteine dioxygenase n=1 Tax=Mycena maculata TaxID=230809 RepID=A0AAD7K1Y2_9AGAR|nr:hypothetical protein DFH07DRAFT_936873 [Mycena maculata]
MSAFCRHSSFFDPFAEGNVVEDSDIFPKAKVLSGLHIDAPPPYSTLKSVLNIASAKVIHLPNDSEANGSFPLTYNAHNNLVIHGQGTVIANCTGPISLLFSFSTEDQSKSSLYAEITETSVQFSYGPTAPHGSIGYLPPDRVLIKGDIIKQPVDGASPEREAKPTIMPMFLRPEMPYTARYWLSIDHNNGILLFGRDYANLALALYEARLKQYVDPGVWHWIDDNTYQRKLTILQHAFIDNVSIVNVQQKGGNLTAPPLQLVSQPLPVVQKLPPIIVPSESITLDQLAVGSATVPANLSAECQRLYANVAGANILLDTPDFPEFSQAIECSVNTEGLLCQKLLKKKAKKDYKNTYLRITLGANLGNSPGPPYVLEIWPAMHASPIHNHGDSHAVIKVLHGKIKAYYFTSLYNASPIGPPAKLEKGDITWIDPENYQCYSYGKDDVRHYEAFDYIDKETDKLIPQFKPNTDMRYDEFKAALQEEWSQRWAQTPNV